MALFHIFRIQSKEPVVLVQTGNLGYFIFIANHCLLYNHTAMIQLYYSVIIVFYLNNTLLGFEIPVISLDYASLQNHDVVKVYM